MSSQPKWNKYEVALLIEAYVKIAGKTGSRNEILQKLSNALRLMATNNGIEIDDAEINNRRLRMPRGVQLGQVVDDVFASVRSVCSAFVTCSHNQDFFQKAKKPACKASPIPISMAGQCKSAYSLTEITSKPIVRAILTNSPRKKLAG